MVEYQIPLSQGGSAAAWNSPIILTMFILGTLLVAVFIVIEWRFVKIPVLPSTSTRCLIDKLK